MNDNIIPFPLPIRKVEGGINCDDSYWGVCPKCGTHDGYLNYGREQ